MRDTSFLGRKVGFMRHTWHFVQNLTFPTVRYFMQDHFSDAGSFASGTYAVVPFKSK